MFRRIAAATLFLLLLCAPAAAASCFWVGGTASWDQTNTGGGGTGGIKWASASGGGTACAAVSGPAAGVPGPSDTATLDGNSGGGTVTVNFGGTVTLQTLTMGAFTGTFDNSVNNNNFTLSLGSTSSLNGSGTGTRTINLGSATYTLSGAGATCNFSTVTNLTLSASSSTIAFTGASGNLTLNVGGTETFGTVTFPAPATGASITITTTALTITTLNLSFPTILQIGGPLTITNAVTWDGLSGGVRSLLGSSGSFSTRRNITFGAGSTLQNFAIQAMNLLGSPTVTNSFDLGNNAGASIAAPSGGGGIIGGWLLKRDLAPAANDNTPMFLRKAA